MRLTAIAMRDGDGYKDVVLEIELANHGLSR